MLKVFRSCDIEKLGDILKSRIKENNDFFNSPFVVFKNVNAEKWFKTYWLKTESNILMSVEFGRINDLIINMSLGSFNIAKENDVMMAITEVITSKRIDSEFVNNYCFNNGVISAIKVRDFAKELASFLIKADLNKIALDDWRSALYKEVKKTLVKYNLYFVSDILNKEYKKNKKIYVFSSFHLDKIYIDYLKKISNDNEVIILMLSSEEEKGKEFLNVYDEDYKLFNVESENIKKTGAVNVCVSVAPSRIREIEIVHSKICELLKNADVKTSDFLVVAPNIGEYVNDIARVFHQDDQDFIDIPYVIKTSMRKESSLYEALDTLFDIYLKGFYTRYDVYKLVSNRLIQKVRDIDDSDVSSFIDAIVEMKIYRKRPAFDDFDFGKKRMLISKLIGNEATMDNAVDLDTIKAKPYSSIDLDDERIVKLNNVIRDLNSFLSLDDDFLYHIEEELSKWFSIKNNDVEENKLFKKVISLINRFKEMNNDNITKELLLTYLKDATMISAGSGGEVFTSGVTFTDLVEGAVLPARFVFIVGFNSNVMPRRDSINEFYDKDLFISNIDLDKCAFYSQVINASDGLFISYLGKNLKTDESYYPSTLLDLVDGSSFLKFDHKKEKDGKEVIDTKIIDIDETRSYRDLYTRKEYKNKDYYNGLFISKEEKQDNVSDEEYQYTYNDIVRLSDFKRFLEEPLKEKAERLMKKKESNLDDAKEEYEPLDFESLDEYKIGHDLLLKLLKNKDKALSDAKIVDDYIRELELIEDLSSDYKKNGLKKIIAETLVAKNDLLSIASGDYQIIRLPDLRMVTDDEQEWLLLCDDELFVYENNHTLTIAVLKKFNNGKQSQKDYLTSYVFSLMYIAEYGDSEEYNVVLYRDKSEKKKEIRKREYKVTKVQALELLNKLYMAYNDYHNNKLIPIEWLDKNGDNLFDLYSDCGRGFWQHYTDRKMYDYETQYGYNDGTEAFKKEFKDACEGQKELIKFMKGNTDE